MKDSKSKASLQKFTFNKKIRSLQLINHVLLIVGVVYLFQEGNPLWLLGTLGSFLFLGIFGANIGLHRLFAHQSFETYRWAEIFLGFTSVLTTMGSTIGWAGLHRFHHGHPDEPKDPHSPWQIGNFRAWVGLWSPVVIPPGIVSDLIRDPLHKFLHRNYFFIIFVVCFFLFLVHPWAPVFLYAIPASLCLNGSSAISVLCHRWGYRNHEVKDHSFNNWLAWILSLGEGWHNNHHHDSKKYRQGERAWEIDPSAWIIEKFLMKKSELPLPDFRQTNPSKNPVS